MFYLVLIASGMASGPVFQGIGTRAVAEVFGAYIAPATCAAILALIGAIGGALLAHHFEASYLGAKHGLVWMLLGGAALLIPPAVSVAAGAVIYVAAVLIGLFLGILVIAALIAIIGSCFSGS